MTRVIGETQIQTAARHPSTPVRMVQRLTTPNAGETVAQQDPSIIAGGSAEWRGHFGGHSGAFLQN